MSRHLNDYEVSIRQEQQPAQLRDNLRQTQ